MVIIQKKINSIVKGVDFERVVHSINTRNN